MANKKINRINFGKTKIKAEYPDFLDIQLKSFQDFFQLDCESESRKNEGLYKVFSENFPIKNRSENFVLDFIDYYIDPPKYTVEECFERGLTYQVDLKARLKLTCETDGHENDAVEIKIKDVYLGTIPYMTSKGTFCINGAERIVVSQLYRSPGVFFGTHTHPNGTKLYSAKVIPFKGSWMEFSTDINNVMNVYFDRKKKLPVTALLRVIGFESDKEILEIFDLAEEIKVNKTSLKKAIGRKLAASVVKTYREDFVDSDTGEMVSVDRITVIVERGTEISTENIDTILDADVKTILLHKVKKDNLNDYSIIFNTLQKDGTNNEKEANEFIYKLIRNADPPDEETASKIVKSLFLSDTRYNLGEVGRYKINRKLNLDISPDTKILTKEDIISIINHLIELSNSKVDVDDIDHLSNRRIRTVGEQLYNEFGVGLSRIARTARESMDKRENEDLQPTDLVNAKSLISVMNSFFGSNQLSQYMDQTNPLSELTHKRRISSLGPGGLAREYAGFEVRDVHYTHYGRLCTIETPEGANIGLISSLCVYARVNRLGFLETPYLKIENGRVKIEEEMKYMTVEEEEENIIAQAKVNIDEEGNILDEKIEARFQADFPIVNKNDERLRLIDVAPNQIASIAASLIPLLEHDDANRALMGSNMMRQAVPLLNPEAPIVGTGIEADVAKDSRNILLAESDGVVEYVDSTTITIRYERTEEEELVRFDDAVKTYELTKFRLTNQGTCINLRPIVEKGQKVQKGEAICEGYGTEKGELALGRNLKVAFMPWKGYNFEDAIVISERVLKEDIFTSIHVEEFSLEVRETKIGNEELTCEIPNVGDQAIKDLDENGLIRIGAEVVEGDILIGKITPKGETDPTPEEKLLHAIFGDKAAAVKDASLKAPPAMKGVVIGKHLFKKKDAKQARGRSKKSANNDELTTLQVNYEKDINNLNKRLVEKIISAIKEHKGASKKAIKTKTIYDKNNKVIIEKGKDINAKLLEDSILVQSEHNSGLEGFTKVVASNWTNNDKVNKLIAEAIYNHNVKFKELTSQMKREEETIVNGDLLPDGIKDLAKVYVAKKRKLKVGDKMAGRHGNKGIVAKIVREEDMPFLEDGTPVDIVLNPLGVPSRMNIGQIYESVLGWAGHELGLKFSTPIFDGAELEEVNSYMKEANLPLNGQVYLYDGGTGEKFDQPATVGYIYMMKLHHLVDDKMHARSIGPYSMVTQQPLGGKAQFGGQRFGEMEVWALEAFGASNILQEILTIKSDDVQGRAKTYEAIVKGDVMPKPGLPESFNVLVHELRCLGLEISFD